MSLDVLEEKWYRKAIAGFKKKWVQMVSLAESFDAFVSGISAVTGIPEGTVRSSLPAVEWSKFQKNAEKYLSMALKKIKAAHRQKKWSVNYRRAFGGRGR